MNNLLYVHVLFYLVQLDDQRSYHQHQHSIEQVLVTSYLKLLLKYLQLSEMYPLLLLLTDHNFAKD